MLKVDFRPRGEDDISVPEDAAEHDVLGIGKIGAVRPGLGVVFGEQDLSVAECEGLVVALRIDVRTVGCEPVPEVIGLAGRGADRSLKLGPARIQQSTECGRTPP